VTGSGTAPSASRELDALLEELDSLRSSVLDKLAGLSEEDARRTTVPSGRKWLTRMLGVSILG
jgi:hypothetical protein